MKSSFAFVCSLLLAAAPSFAVVRVGIYDDGGGGGSGPSNVEKCLASLEGSSDAFTCQRVTAEQVRSGILQQIDVLVQPGGSGSKQAATLGPDGKDQIRSFVRKGGGYVGICAGAYLATTNYSWSLGLLNAKVVDSKHWARGTGMVEITLTDDGKNFLKRPDDQVTIYYGQGPLLAPDQNPALPAYTPLAVYKTEIAKNGAPKSVMIGCTAIATSTFGNGRVICLSPHAEKTKGLSDFIRRAVAWSAGDHHAASQPAAPTP